jgi:plastocyanin
VIAKALAAVIAALVLLPATASASVTRAIQSVSTPTSLYWYPKAVPAQQGDTIEWRMTEPGNPNAAVHDVWLIKPGADPSTATQLGATWLGDGTAHAVVDQVGTYTFYCSIHGGLAQGGMNGTITVGTTNPGPPVDPGHPWESDPGGGDGFPNPTQPPTVFEEGDNTPPTLTFVSATIKKRTVTMIVDNVDGIRLGYSITKKKKVIERGDLPALPGRSTVSIRVPNKPGDYAVNVWSIDVVDLESDPVTVHVISTAKAAKLRSRSAHRAARGRR